MGAIRTIKRSMTQFFLGDRSKHKQLGKVTRSVFKQSELDKHINIKVEKSKK